MSQAGQINVVQDNPQIPIIFQTDSGNATAMLNILEILGGPGTATSALGNVITISVSGTGFAWNVVTSASNPITLAKENGYIPKGAISVVFQLPAAASVGDVFRIIGYGNLWTIQQNANQSITIGIKTSTVGVGGSVNATSVSDGIELLCVTANTEFFEISMQGNPLIV